MLRAYEEEIVAISWDRTRGFGVSLVLTGLEFVADFRLFVRA